MELRIRKALCGQELMRTWSYWINKVLFSVLGSGGNKLGRTKLEVRVILSLYLVQSRRTGLIDADARPFYLIFSENSISRVVEVFFLLFR